MLYAYYEYLPTSMRIVLKKLSCFREKLTLCFRIVVKHPYIHLLMIGLWSRDSNTLFELEIFPNGLR